jgi:chromosome segregation ATPase
MTEEEKEAIEYIKKEIDYFKTTILGFEKEMEDKDWLRKNILELKNDISTRKTILNLIQKQDTELQQVLNDYQELGKDYHKLECEFEKKDTEINKLKQENHTLKEQGKMFIPRRRVRRVYKMLGKILKVDIDPVLLEKELKSEERRGEYE